MFRFSHKVVGVRFDVSLMCSKNRFDKIRMLHSLVKDKAFVNGSWTEAGDKKRFDVINPANLKVIANVPDLNVADAEKAVDSAYDAFYSRGWQNTTAKERSGLLKV